MKRERRVAHLSGRNREDFVEFLESEGFGFGHEKPNENCTDDIPSSVPSESSLRLEGTEETREGKSDDEIAVGPREN